MLAALCVLLVSWSCSVRLAAACTSLLGDGDLSHYQSLDFAAGGGTIYSIGYFVAPPTTDYQSYECTYAVPDQSSYTTPNSLRLAVYTNTNPASLVVQSQPLTIASTPGTQQLSAGVESGGSLLKPGTQYVLGQLTVARTT